MRFVPFILLLLIPVAPLRAQSPADDFDPAFPAWNRVLARCATPDGFRYATLAADPSDLEVALIQLGRVTRKQFERFPRDLQLAFLINAHNAHAVNRVTRKYPVKSIEGTALIGSALNKRFRLLGRRRSLSSLRDEILGDHYQDIRALFLLNWGMKGCAPLPTVPITEHNIQELLELQTQRFVRNPLYHSYVPTETKYHVSALLKEYESEIDRDYTSIFSFLEHFASSDAAGALKLRPTKIEWMKFDKSLNDLP